MYAPRTIASHPDWLDADGIKLYTISARHAPVDQAPYRLRLERIKATKTVDWSITPAFAIFHDGAGMAYLVLAWWGNDNELFTSVSVQTPDGWVESPSEYSFCVYDLEVFWHERNAFVQQVYCARPDLARYRADRLSPA